MQARLHSTPVSYLYILFFWIYPKKDSSSQTSRSVKRELCYMNLRIVAIRHRSRWSCHMKKWHERRCGSDEEGFQAMQGASWSRDLGPIPRANKVLNMKTLALVTRTASMNAPKIRIEISEFWVRREFVKGNEIALQDPYRGYLNK